MTSNDDLLDTIEDIRRRQFPDIPAELLAELVAIERDHPANRLQAQVRIERAIDLHLAAIRPGESGGA